MPENFKIYLEIFGYIGTALVIISMMMTSVLKLRAINICGGIISAIYSSFYGAWAVVIMNVCLVIINICQIIIQLSRKRNFEAITPLTNDKSVEYFLSYHKSDIQKFFPNFNFEITDSDEVHTIYVEGELAGIIIGKRDGDVLNITLDYTTPKYRDLSVAKFIFPKLGECGIRRLVATSDIEQHTKYLKKMGFENKDGTMIKNL